MTTIAIMQPTFMPWAGYFNLIANVDRFVFFDDVQFSRRSWQVRNRILLAGDEFMLSAPTQKASFDASLNEIMLSRDPKWKRKQLKTIQAGYGKAPFYKEMFDLVQELYSVDAELLADFNIKQIKLICKAMGVNSEFYRSSQLSCQGQRSQYIESICRELNASHYLSPVGSKDYLEEDSFHLIEDIELSFQSYQPASYQQIKSAEFISHMSILDVIANIGLENSKYYCEGQYEG